MAAHTEQIKSDAKTIRELLDKVKYKIDFFQREYKWQFKQIELLIEGIPERNEERCFYSFFDRLGNCYKNQSLRSLFKPYKDIRNGLVHAYLDKDVTIRLSRGSCGIVLNSSQKQVKYTFHIRTYLMILELQSMVILENCQPVLKQFKKWKMPFKEKYRLSKRILRIHSSMEEIIILFKSAQNKGNDPYALDKTKSAYHDCLDALRLALCVV